MHIEFFGIPRQRAGVAGVEIQADTLGQLLGTIAAEMPQMAEFISADRLDPAFVANLNGAQFISDPGTLLLDDDCVIILSADAGG